MHILNIDNTTILIAVGGVVILVALLMMGRRLRRFVFKAGGINASAEAGATGARVGDGKIKGSFNEGIGRGANVSVTGSSNTVNARIGKDDDP